MCGCLCVYVRMHVRLCVCVCMHVGGTTPAIYMYVCMCACLCVFVWHVALCRAAASTHVTALLATTAPATAAPTPCYCHPPLLPPLLLVCYCLFCLASYCRYCRPCSCRPDWSISAFPNGGASPQHSVLTGHCTCEEALALHTCEEHWHWTLGSRPSHLLARLSQVL